ncbi:hypothetical protein GCM10010251_17430 [Streptomyces aurantiogriseus]|uniref:Uncharacterized protein n=1 Tax=Streptomyces aurantiogriseus TaxID=66870 RepID=A0A918F2V0_9ACTN|nr:hypothetical protein GCM10010251_17430 [Streptomyces aurantiogriseus]
MDVHPELVDEAVPQEGGGEVGTAETQVAARLLLEGPDLLGTTSRTIVVFQSACCKVRE